MERTGRTRRLTADDSLLFRRYVDGLPGDAIEAPDDGSPPGHDAAPGASLPLRPRPAPPPGGLDRHAARALRRGRHRIEARLDLHGMTRAAAHAALARFLSDNARRGRKCVLVITGRGRHLHTDPEDCLAAPAAGVLRDAVPYWLKQPDLARFVVATGTAQPRDGGAGARYVLLRPLR